MEQLFDNLHRTDASPSQHGEGSFKFLNRSASSYFGYVRELIEEWLGHVPEKDQPPLRGALRADDAKFAAAFWELYLHEAYRRSGFEIEVHPSVPCASTHPDFLLTRDGEQFYLEAGSVGRPPVEIGEDRRVAEVKDSLSEIYSPNFSLGLSVRAGPLALATKPLRERLESWVETLDADEVTEEASSVSELPDFRWTNAGWELRIRAIPLAKSARGTHWSALGVSSSAEGMLVDDVVPFRKVLDKKRRKYGRLDLPLVVAIQLNSVLLMDDEDIADALYGPGLARGVGPADLQSSGLDDAFWFGRDGWRNGSIPQVVTISKLFPGTVTSSAPRCWTSTEPETDSPSQPDWMTHVTVGGDPQAPAWSMATHFGLAVDWPGMDRPDFDLNREDGSRQSRRRG